MFSNREAARTVGLFALAFGYLLTFLTVDGVLQSGHVGGATFLLALAVTTPIWIGVWILADYFGVVQSINALPAKADLPSELESVAMSKPPVIVRTYDTGSFGAEGLGRREYEREARELDALGYEPVHSAGTEKFAWVGASLGKLTVTYRRKQSGEAQMPASQQSVDSSKTKVCPDCAEEVQAAARVCRYCRHEFA